MERSLVAALATWTATEAPQDSPSPTSPTTLAGDSAGELRERLRKMEERLDQVTLQNERMQERLDRVAEQNERLEEENRRLAGSHRDPDESAPAPARETQSGERTRSESSLPGQSSSGGGSASSGGDPTTTGRAQVVGNRHRRGTTCEETVFSAPASRRR